MVDCPAPESGRQGGRNGEVASGRGVLQPDPGSIGGGGLRAACGFIHFSLLLCCFPFDFSLGLSPDKGLRGGN